VLTGTYTPGNDNQEWVVMWHCSKDNVNFYTIQGKHNVLYGGAINGGYVGVTTRNGGNETGKTGGCARICLIASGVSYVAGEGKPDVSVISVTANSVTLSWKANKFAEKFNVRCSDKIFYSNGDSIGIDTVSGTIIYKQIPYLADTACLKIDNTTELSYKFTNLVTDVDYYFTVQPVDSVGLLGEMSDIEKVKAVPLSKFVPFAPEVGVITMKTVEMKWLANPDALRYTLYYWTKADSSDLKAATVETTSYVITDLPANTTVYAILAHRTQYMWSKGSAIVSATTLPYSTFKMTMPSTSNVTDWSMSISWDAAIDAASYNVYFTSEISKISSVAPVNVPSITMNMGRLKADTQYYIQICAVDAKGVLSQRSGTKITKTAKIVGESNVVSGLENADNIGLGVISESSTLRILNAQDKLVTVYSVTGKKIYSQMVTSADERLNTTLGQGLYMVRVDDQTVKAMIK
jgi:hypothetical protein